MSNYCIFLDESGMSNPKEYLKTPYYSLCGVVVSNDSRLQIKKDWEELKTKYFKRDFILHSTEIRKLLKTITKIENFSKSLDNVLSSSQFFLLYVVIDNKEANARSWQNITVDRKAYRKIIGNLIKFLIAKNAIGQIYAEASKISQDIVLYQNFFHFLANGIPELSISSDDVKRHLTAVSFVTKSNNDIEEQIAGLFVYIGRVKVEVDKGKRSLDNLDPIENVLLKHLEKHIFIANRATKLEKVRLYSAIDSLWYSLNAKNWLAAFAHLPAFLNFYYTIHFLRIM